MDPDRASSNYHSLPHRISTTNVCEGLTFGPNVAIRSPSSANCPHHLSCHFLTASDTPQMYQYAGELGLGWWLKLITGALKTVRLLGQDRISQDKSRLTNMCTCNCFFIYAAVDAWTYIASLCRPFTPPMRALWSLYAVSRNRYECWALCPSW